MYTQPTTTKVYNARLKTLSIKETAQALGMTYANFYNRLASGVIPKHFEQKDFDDTGHFVRRCFYEADVPEIKRILDERAASPVVYKRKRTMTPEARAIMSQIQKAAWVRRKQLKNGAIQGVGTDQPPRDHRQEIAIELIKKGFDDAGVYLLKGE